jgi:hypothetical protein
MRLESVRSLKEDILEGAWSRRVMTKSGLPREAAIVGSALPALPPPPPIALGIEGKSPHYRLAIRLQEVSPGLQQTLDEILRRAKGEASIRVIGRLSKQQFGARNRPLLLGSSIGHPRVAAGTLGCFVTRHGFDRYILSNNHVLANENRERIGDEILQPAPADRGLSPVDCVAALSGFTPLSHVGKNLVDAAVALVREDIEADLLTLTGLGTLQGPRASSVEGGEIVFKVGRTTGLTRGRVSAFEMDDIWIRYDTGTLGFDGQIEIEPLDSTPFSLGGDSGALIVDEACRAVGLLFAGNDVDVTYANPIDPVLRALGVRLLAGPSPGV